MRKIKNVSELSSKTDEGKILIATLGKLNSTKEYNTKYIDNILEECIQKAKEIFSKEDKQENIEPLKTTFENWDIVLSQQNCPYWENNYCKRTFKVSYPKCTYENCPIKKKIIQVNCNNETTFENAQIGDNAWDNMYGMPCEIYKIEKNTEYPIKTKFRFEGAKKDICKSFTYDGYENKYYRRTLFWDKVSEPIAPTRPKKIKKVINAWTNIYPDGSKSFYESIDAANIGADNSRIACVYLTGEYEIKKII